MNKILTNPRVLLPLSIMLGVSIIGIRAADMWDVVSSGKLLIKEAQAEEKEKPKHEESKSKEASKEKEAPKEKEASKEKEGSKEKEAGAHTAEGAPKAAEDHSVEPHLAEPPPEADSSPAEIDVLKQLSDRREQLEKRSRDLDGREALLKVSEQRVDQKIKELELLRKQLQAMVNQVGGAQQAQLDNLVKIYETMKPDEAAKIFETLDMPVLLGVFQKMKPARTAPIMAKMAPEKAKEITVALTKQDQLPQVK